MNWADSFYLKLRRAETPFYARLNRAASTFLRVGLPAPKALRPVFGFLVLTRAFIYKTARIFLVIIFRSPAFRSRCHSVGEGLYLEQLPSISGPVRITVGSNVTISGRFGVASGRVIDEPELIIGDRVFIGHDVRILVSRRIVIEEGAAIAGDCFLADNDGHPADILSRIRRENIPFEETQPIHIGRYAWIGRGCYIMKGVTIGEGAVVGIGSVVLSDVPPFSVAIGNPARVVRKIPPVPLDNI